MKGDHKQKNILWVIVLSQFAGTSLWFVGNAVLPELKESLHLSRSPSKVQASGAVKNKFRVNNLYSIYLVTAAWSRGSTAMVSNCFHKDGFSMDVALDASIKNLY